MATFFRTLSPHPLASTKVFVRRESSARRLTKRLRAHPHPSMLLTPTSPKTTHIVHNPPSAPPTPLITPSIFLPSSDPRKSLLPKAQPSPPEATEGKQKLPPPLRLPYEKTYHLTPKDFERMRELRALNPQKWNRNALAKEFKCSTLFVGMVCQADQKRLEEVKLMGEKIRARWGEKRRLAREERSRRRGGWGGRDGLS